MLTLIFFVLVILIVIFYREWDKGHKPIANGIGVWISFIAALLVLGANINISRELKDRADVPKKYEEAQEKVIILQSEIQKLKDEYKEKDADTFITEYLELAEQLEETELYIEENRYFVEHGQSKDRFWLYFGK